MLVALAGASETDGRTAAEMRTWVGKYPASPAEMRHATSTTLPMVNFLGHPEVKALIKSILGLDAISQMKKMSTVGPIEQHGDWLIAYGCQPHMCSDGDWLLAINLISLEARGCLALVDAPTVRFGASVKGYVDLPRVTTGLTARMPFSCPEPEQALAVFERVFAGARIEVPMQKVGGTFVVPVEINGTLTLDFTIDSGAADVSVPLDVFSTLRRTGAIQNADITGQQTYVLADGSTRQTFTFTIRSLKVGDTVVYNVRGSVAPLQGSLLLGQSFLERFKSWSLDNAMHVLLLEPQ